MKKEEVQKLKGNLLMEFNIIPNQQTPAVPEIGDVGEFIRDHKEELEGFLKYASSRTDAVGLAANQVALNGKRLMLRAFALRNMDDNTWRLIINPEITEYSGINELKDEGCLTWIGKRIIAKRHRAVHVTYYNMQGAFIKGFYKGFPAQVWQHEIDHLNGVEERIEELYFKLPKQIDVGRNEKCPCESGKKFKACCIE